MPSNLFIHKPLPSLRVPLRHVLRAGQHLDVTVDVAQRGVFAVNVEAVARAPRLGEVGGGRDDLGEVCQGQREDDVAPAGAGAQAVVGGTHGVPDAPQLFVMGAAELGAGGVGADVARSIFAAADGAASGDAGFAVGHAHDIEGFTTWADMGPSALRMIYLATTSEKFSKEVSVWWT